MHKHTPPDPDLEVFRKHVISLPMRQTDNGWEFTNRPDGQAKKVLLDWIKSVLSYDDYGYPKSEDLLPDEEEINGMYQGLFRNALDNVTHHYSAAFALVIMPCWLGKKQKQVNYFMGYDEESFQASPAFGTMAYYAPVSDLSQLHRRLNSMQDEGDPVKFLHRTLSGEDAKMAYHQWDHSKR